MTHLYCKYIFCIKEECKTLRDLTIDMSRSRVNKRNKLNLFVSFFDTLFKYYTFKYFICLIF